MLRKYILQGKKTINLVSIKENIENLDLWGLGHSEAMAEFWESMGAEH